VRTSVLLPLGATLGLLGFVALAVEGLRVAIGDISLSGWEAAVPWVGLGVMAVGALLLVTALLGGDEPPA
jgi:hypothetical protein